MNKIKSWKSRQFSHFDLPLRGDYRWSRTIALCVLSGLERTKSAFFEENQKAACNRNRDYGTFGDLFLGPEIRTAKFANPKFCDSRNGDIGVFACRRWHC